MIDEVVLVRHGRTSYNLARRMQGQIDIPLDIVGQWQADQTGYALASRYYWAKASHVAANPDLLAQPGPGAPMRASIDEYRGCAASRRTMRVVCSDLFRARRTAEAIAAPLGLPVEPDARLRERSFGRWEGMTRAEIREMDAAAYDSWKAHTGGELAYGVEAREAVGARGAAALEDYVRSSAGEETPSTLMVVSHGSWITCTVQTLLGIADMAHLGGMRNAFWCRLTPHAIPGIASGVDPDARGMGSISWDLEEYNQGPVIAATCDWENGPEFLRNPSMPAWRPIHS